MTRVRVIQPHEHFFACMSITEDDRFEPYDCGLFNGCSDLWIAACHFSSMATWMAMEIEDEVRSIFSIRRLHCQAKLVFGDRDASAIRDRSQRSGSIHRQSFCGGSEQEH